MTAELGRRPARTAMQAAPAWVLTEFVDAWVYDMTDRQFGALVALLMLAGSWLLVALENYAGRRVLRDA